MYCVLCDELTWSSTAFGGQQSLRLKSRFLSTGFFLFPPVDVRIASIWLDTCRMNDS